MHKHASINRAFRLIWSEALATWIPVAETARGRGKRNGRSAARVALLLAALGGGLSAPAAGVAALPVPAPALASHTSVASATSTSPVLVAPTTLPSGGQVVAGAAVIAPGSSPGTAVLNIDQSTQRAVIDWNTFNVGSAAQVNFHDPNSAAVTLNRVLDSNASQIFGKITATGQVFLVNPNGVYFARSASVDVGGLVATTESIGNADFMAGGSTFVRNGATGSIVNDGTLQANLGGYIALLAPEVRNTGVVIAHLGTVALAAGDAFTLTLDGTHLAGLTVKPATLAALIENQGAVIAPGGLIILSAQALDHLQGGVVNNSGTLEATGLATHGGRIVLEASDSVANSGTINASAGADRSPAGSITLTAPAIENSGTISTAAPSATPGPAAVTDTTPARSSAANASLGRVATAGGSILLNASTIVQTAAGRIDASGGNGGSIALNATQNMTVAGSVSAAATVTPAGDAPTDLSDIAAEGAPASGSTGHGGHIALSAGHDITLQSALLDVSGSAGGGQITVTGGAPSPTTPPLDPPTVALLGATQLRGSSRRGQGGTVTLTGDRVGLFDTASIDVSGATGGGDVYVGGGFHGQDPSIADAQQTVIASTATIDADATQAGDGGLVAVWSDGQTAFAGRIAARGGATSGDGGYVEVSGKGNLQFVGTVDAGAAHGKAGTLLLDPTNIIIATGGSGALTSGQLAFGTNSGNDSTVDPVTITGFSNAGTAVVLQASNDLTINNSIITAASGTPGSLTFQAGRSITVNASVISDNANITFSANDSGANATYRAAGAATFTNNSVIDAGSGTVSITIGTQGASGAIETGHVAGANLIIAQNGPTGGAVNGAIDLGESDLTGNLTITASSATNVTNTLGSTGNAGNVVVRGTASINVGTGNVTINGPHTDFSIIGLTAGTATLNDTSAVEFATTNLSGNLMETTLGPIASTGSVQVAGTTTLTANNGGFGVGDPYINLTNASNHFGGAVTLSVPSVGATGTGGYATVRDSGAISILSSNTATSLAIQAGGAVTTTSITAGTSFGVTSSSGVVALGATTTGTSLSVSAAGAVSLGTTGVGTNLTVSTAGAITNTGTLTVAQQTTLTAGSANNITLDNANNDFSSVQILSANNVTLVDKNAINFGNYLGWYGQASLPSSMAGNFNVTAGGDISQSGYNNTNASAITVGGTATFTANNASAPINLWLGTSNPFNPGSGSANNIAGTVTLARNNTNTGFSTVELRNINSGASVLTGLTSVGTLTGVYLTYDAAPSVSLPGMTVSGNLEVYAPSVANTATTPANIISQLGAISVTGSALFEAGSTGDVVLTTATNNMGTFGVIQSRNTTLVTQNGVVLNSSNAGADQVYSGNLTITAGGNISDAGRNIWIQTGTLTLNAGTGTIYLGSNVAEVLSTVAVTAAGATSIDPWLGLILGNVSNTGTLNFTSRNYGYGLSQLANTAVATSASSTTTFGNFSSGITLANAANVFGPLYIFQAGAISLEENAAITQAQGWSNYNNQVYNVSLVTANDQAITLTQSGNDFGPLTITQVNSGSSSPGAVSVTENGNSINGMTEGGAWTVHGTTTLNGGSYSIALTNASNVFGPLQVLATTGTTGSTGNTVASTVTIYAKNATTDAITDVGATGAWSTGADVVGLLAYSSAGVAGQGNITLTNAANALGALYLKGNNVSVTNNASITDGPSTTVWDSASGASDTGWVTTGATSLVVASPAGKTITLSNLTNLIGPLALSTTGSGALTSVLVTDNDPISQAAVWNVGATPVTLDARAHSIDLSTYGNVLGAISINTINGTPTSVAITENDAITQGTPWVLGTVPVTLVAQGGNAITLGSATNTMGNLTITGGAVSILENADITQGGAWSTTGTTTLNPTAHAITLTNAANVLGNIAIAGTPSSVSITENDDITQASAWVQTTMPVTLNAGTHNIVLSQATNQLGSLTLTAANATVTENGTAGISNAAGGAWVVSGTTTLTAGTANPIVLNGSASSDFGTVSIVSASTATIADVNGIIMGPSTIATGGTLTVSAGGAITQSGAITAPSLRLIGTGSATLTNASNNVANLAAGFTGGDLTFTDSGNFAVAVVGGTTGIAINANNVTLASVAGTVTGLSYVNASSGSLTLNTGTALSLPQMGIAGAQTYTAGGGGITLTAGVNSSAAGAITFESPVTLAAPLTVSSANSPINFASTLAGGTKQLTVNAGSGTVDFHGAVTALGLTTDASAALTLTSGSAAFDTTVGANNGLAITGPVVFSDTVTLGAGSAASVFTGLVTLGKAGGMNLSGYNGMSFDGGVLLQNGAASINTNNSPLNFQTAGSVSGAFGLTLNSGTAALVGLNRMGTNLTSLTVTALSPTIPAGGISIAGPQTYTATSGSSITLAGNDSSTLAGAITFNSPVSVSAASSVSTVNSPVVFASTVDGNNNLTINAGSATTTFTGAVGSIAPLGSGTGAAITLQGAGATTFDSTVVARSGLAAAGPVTFDGNVTLAAGTTGSTFAGLVTAGATGGDSISGFGGIAFNGGLAITGGALSVISNGSTLSFGAPVSGAQSLTLNALAAGAGTVTGLNEIGTTSGLTALSITAQTLILPSTGLAVAGPMTFTAAGGITANGAIGSSSAPATGAITFTGPVSLAMGAITVTTNNAAINFSGTVNGAQALTVNSGTGTTTFGAAVGGTTALSSLATGSAGATVLSGGSIQTSGAQSYNDAVTLGAATTLTGVNVQFAGTLNGAYALAVNDSGATAFGGIVGGASPLLSITTDAPGTVDVNTSAVTTTGAQTYHENMTLGTNAALNGVGLTFGGSVNGPYGLTANSGSGALQFIGTVGAGTALTSLSATGNTVAAASVTTGGTQSYVANAGITLSGTLATTGSAVTATGPTTLGADVSIQTTGGNITFAGATSTVNGAHNLTLTAGAGNVVLGGAVGGITPLSGFSDTGFDLTLPAITTVNDANQTYTALDNITLNTSRTLNAPVSFTADSDGNGAGSFILASGVSLTASNNTLSITAADILLSSTSTLSSGSGLMTITATDGRNIALGGPAGPIAGQMTITGTELSHMTTSGGLNLDTTGAGWIDVNGITAAQSANVTGALTLNAGGTGTIGFITAASTFKAVTTDAVGGLTTVGVNLTTSNTIEFMTPVSVSGASTINSGGGNISFDSTLAVANNLILSTGNGALTFGGVVNNNQTLTLNLGGGTVAGLGELQSTLTGLTVNGAAGITLPAFTINGPQVYNTGTITATGNLGGTGITFNNIVNVVPANGGTALTLNAGTGTLLFSNQASFNASNLTLIADQISFTHAVTGQGSLALQPFTTSLPVIVGGTATPSTSLNVTAADLGWLPQGTLTGVTLGSATGTGALTVAGTLNVQATALTLNGSGGISQSASVSSGALTLYAAGNAITLTNAGNAFGAVALNGTPSTVSLTNTLDIDQLGSNGWVLGNAPVTLNANTHNIALTNAGNTSGTLVLNGSTVQVTEASATDIGASTVTRDLTVTSGGAINFSGALAATGNVTLSSAGAVTQAAPLTIGGNLAVTTALAAGDVSIDNSGAAATLMGNALVGGDYVLTATGKPVSQAPGTSYEVAGNLTVTGSSVDLGGAGNATSLSSIVTLPASTTDLVTNVGTITLGARTEAGNLTVISESTGYVVTSSPVHGSAIVLTNSANSVAGSISVSASPPTVTNTGADVPTGISQAGGTAISVTGVASFTAEASTAGSSGVNLPNAGNHFGTLVLSGNTVGVLNDSSGLTTIGGALATTSLVLNTAGGLAQSGAIITPALTVHANGAVTLNNVANAVNTLGVTNGGNAGNAISFVNAGNLSIAGITAGGANVSLTAAGAGANLTQSAALSSVGALSANAGGAVVLTNTGNTVTSLAASGAGTGFALVNSQSLSVGGLVATATGDLSIRASGDLTLAPSGQLVATTGNLVASTEGAGNFINDSTSAGAALVVGTGDRWLVYSDTPDLVGTVHTVKGGLTSSFRHYGATYGSYAPGSVTEGGDGFIYQQAAGTLTVSAIINGTASQVYGSSPTGTLGYTISAGQLDSEDTTANVVSSGTATYSGALSNTLNAGSYSFLYTGGLVSNYTLAASTTGVAYTVTPAVLTYTATPASRAYGAANPTLTGTIGGFQLGQNSSVLSGAAAWTTAAAAGTGVGQYAIAGSGYSLLNGSTNYTFAQALSNATAFTIGKAALTVTAANAARTYDGTSYSGGNGVSYAGFVNGDSTLNGAVSGTVTYGGTSQGARNVGSYTITPSGLTSGNYTLGYANGTLAVSRANLTLSTSNVSRTYNGTVAAAGAAVVSSGTLFGSDSLSGGSFAFTSANAGAGNRTVTVSGVTVNDTDGGGDYSVSYAPNTTSTITPASLTISANNATKTYNSLLNATDTPTVTSGLLYHNVSNSNTQDSISGGTFAYTDGNAGTANKTVTVSGVTVTDGNNGGNYTVTYASNTTSTINPLLLTFVGSITERAYDGTTVATLAGDTLTGLISGQNLVASDTSATFADKNAGIGKTVTINGITLANGTNGTASNYSIASTATALGTIDPKLLTVNAVVNNKVYDRTTTATLASYGLSGFVGTETVVPVYTGSATFADKNVGTAKLVTITGMNLVAGTNGGLASNYSVAPTATGTANITPATLLVAGVVALDKVYDGTTIANMNTQGAQLTGVIGLDNVTIGSITGTYQNKNVGANKAIGTGTVVLSGADAIDYTLVQPSGLTSSITRRTLTVSATGINKVYDTTTAAAATLTDNRIAGDALSISSTDAFLDKNVGTGKYVSITNIALGGTDAGNYIANTSTATSASITQANLTAILTGVNKVYDSTTNATVTVSATPLGADVVTLNAASAAFADKNVGTDKTVTVSGITGSGADAGNYDISAVGSTTANITPAVISQVTGVTAANKVYDGTTTATLVSGTLGFVGEFSGDSLTAVATNAVFNDKNAGTSKPVTISGLVLAGADAGNYTLNAQSTVSSAADITPRPLTVSATGINKVYDTTTAATAILTDNRVAGDTLTITSSDAFLDKNAGVGKYVDISNIVLGGTDAGNYTVNGSTSTSANITPAVLMLSATGVNKVYDANTGASVTLADTPLAGDVVAVSFGTATFADKNVGAAKTVTVHGIIASGADAGNYTLTGGTTTTANITPASLTVAATAASRPYNGQTGADVTLADNRYAGDQLTLTDASANFADATPGTGKLVTVDGIQIAGGADQGNYVLMSNSVTTSGTIFGDLTDGAAAQASLPPVQFVASPIAVPTAAPPLLDLTLPADYVVFSPPDASDVDAPQPDIQAAPSDQVKVSAVQPGSGQLTGTVSVFVPHDLIASGSPFSFSLPDDVNGQSPQDKLLVTGMSRRNLPSWLQFMQGKKTFQTTAIPAGALPLDILVSRDGKRWKVTITDRPAK